MDKVRSVIATSGAVIGIILLVLGMLFALFAKGNDPGQFAIAQAFGFAGLGFVIAGRK